MANYDESEKILLKCPNIKFQVIGSEDVIQSKEEPMTLIVSKNLDHEYKLQVGSWEYRLVPEDLQAVKHEDGALIFPDTHNKFNGAQVVLFLEKEQYTFLSKLFEDVSIKPQSSKESKCIESSTIVNIADSVANYLVYGANVAAQFIDNNVSHLIDKGIKTKEEPACRPELVNITKGCAHASKKAAVASDFAATKIENMSCRLGKSLVQSVHNEGPKILSSFTQMPKEEASSKINSAVNTVANTIHGISTVYKGGREAVGIIAESFVNNTTQLIQHKYGDSAGTIAKNTFTTIGNVVHTWENLKIVKPRSFAKSTAKQAAYSVIKKSRRSSI